MSRLNRDCGGSWQHWEKDRCASRCKESSERRKLSGKIKGNVSRVKMQIKTVIKSLFAIHRPTNFFHEIFAYVYSHISSNIDPNKIIFYIGESHNLRESSQYFNYFFWMSLCTDQDSNVARGTYKAKMYSQPAGIHEESVARPLFPTANR